MTPAQYDATVADLVNYLVFMGEPARGKRVQIGILTLLFLAVLFVFAYALKKEYWKDVH
jgi:ubiquinol-cytochrome c reductase cytochrome c1 subunit